MLLETQEQESGWVEQLGLSNPHLQLVARLFGETPLQFHGWMLSAANRMRNAGMSIDQALEVLIERARMHSRPVPLGEIRKAVEKAFNGTCGDFRPTPRGSGFSRLRAHQKLWALMRSQDWPQGYGMEELRSDGPDASESLCQLRPERLLNLLFNGCQSDPDWGGRYLCVAAKRKGEGYRAETNAFEPGDNWSIPGWANLVVPNLAHSPTGVSQEGKISNRSLDMFPQRDYIVLESDLGEGTEDTQAALIRFTQKVLTQRPVMVLHSGNKSLHSWWSMWNLEESKVELLLRELAGLFDTAALRRNQPFRLPNGWRDVEAEKPVVKQEVILFDHEALGSSAV